MYLALVLGSMGLIPAPCLRDNAMLGYLENECFCPAEQILHLKVYSVSAYARVSTV